MQDYISKVVITLESLFSQRGVLLGMTLFLCASCSVPDTAHYGVKDGVVVSVKDQKMAVIQEGKLVKQYPVSTSKYGLGDRKGSRRTPLGKLKVASKVGEGHPQGMVFKSRRPTGEIIAPNAPGRDPIVTRIIALEGTESWNKNALTRCIYIHGTPEENRIGHPASYGCIRMKSADIVDLYYRVRKGTEVIIDTCSLNSSIELSEKM